MTRLVLGSLLLFLTSQPDLRAAETPTLEKDIQPLLKSRCFECHGIDQPKAELDLRTRAGMLKGGRHGPGIVPGSLKESQIWLNVSTDKMPSKGNKLTDTEKDLFRRWILAGAPGEGVTAIHVATTRSTTSTPVKQLGVVQVARLVDAAIDAKLREAKLTPSPIADDADFLRRAWLDLTGLIPSRTEAAEFLDSTDAQKRSKLVDGRLAAAEFGKFHAGIWARMITAEEPTLKAGLEGWLAQQFNDNRTWDAIVRDLISATGKGPETSFVMSNVENKIPQPEKLAGSTARLFLGMQLQCAECHNHPFADWKQTDFWGLAAFYSRTRMQTKEQPMGLAEVAKPGTKLNSGASITIPNTAGKASGSVIPAKFLGGEQPKFEENAVYRPALAEWITARANPFFAKAAVNRLWAHFFGRGLVNPIDDMHDENPPTHPEVLELLANEFRASGYDLKHLIRCICATQAYQRSTKGPPGSEKSEPLFGRMALKVMSPEAIYDSLVSAFGVKELRINTGYIVTSGRGGQGANTKNPRDSFIRFFNTRDADSLATDFTHGIPQALSLMNDPQMNQAMPLVTEVMKAESTPEKRIEALYLGVLARRPSSAERKVFLEYVTKRSNAPRAYSDLVWILSNSMEFILIR